MSRIERLADNESAFRDVNERLAAAEVPAEGELLSFLCECADIDCLQPVELARREYEAVRSDGAQFVIAPDHAITDLERVVLQTDRYWVAKKLGGAGAIAEELDPRA